jgi:hypothetical protein
MIEDVEDAHAKPDGTRFVPACRLPGRGGRPEGDARRGTHPDRLPEIAGQTILSRPGVIPTTSDAAKSEEHVRWRTVGEVVSAGKAAL